VEVRPRMLTSLNSEEAAASDETVAEALTYLLERSDTQEGQLAKLYSASRHGKTMYWRFTRLAGNLLSHSEAMGDERDSPVGGDCGHDDLLELRFYDHSARKADLRVYRQWRGCVSSTPKSSISATVLPPGKRNPPPSLQCCNVSAKSCLRSPSVHSVSLFLVEDRRAAWARAAGATECLAVSRRR
jgi:hypothetical protein